MLKWSQRKIHVWLDKINYNPIKYTVKPPITRIVNPLLFELLIGSKINKVKKQLYEFKSEKNIKEIKNKIFKELESGSKKENYFSENEKIIIINFINKIKSELQSKNLNN